MSRILLKYKALPTHFFGDSYEFPYELTILKTSFFGIIKKEEKIRYNISMFQNIKEHTDHWDKMIENKCQVT